MIEYIGTGIYDQSPAGGGGGAAPQDITQNESSHSPSETAMLNEALGTVGADHITGIDDESLIAEHCRTIYPPLLDAILRMHDWNFAGARARLTAQVQAPLFGYAYQFMLPPGLIKVRNYNGYPVQSDRCCIGENQYTTLYAIEGKKLLTYDSNVYMIYTCRVRDVTLWDPLFYQVMTTWLASKFADAIPRDAKKSADLLTKAMTVYLPLAVSVDSQENPVQPMESSSLTWGR